MELAPLLTAVPPWLAMAALVGAMNAAACFLFVGRRTARLPLYLVIGALAAGLGQVFAQTLGIPQPVVIGELNVLAASAAAWLVVGAARLAGL